MPVRISVGDRVPQVLLSRLVGGEIQHVDTHALLANKRAVIVGIPGAYTPVCTCTHVPNLISNYDRLRRRGFDMVAVIVPDNPWVTDAWANSVDPSGKLQFFSDGNLDFARDLGVSVVDYRNFLGETSSRYLLLSGNGIVRRLNVEAHGMDLTCTRAEDVVLID